MPKIDLTNKQFKYFKVLKKNEQRKGKNVWWDCECQCGNIFTATTTDLNKEKIKSCGCMRSQLLSEAHLQDITGQRFGNLTVLKRDFLHEQSGKKQRTYWLCKCDCGNVISVERTHLVNRQQISCGCKNSIGEFNIHKILQENNILYTSQYTNSNLKTNNNGYLRFDFAILNEDDKIIRFIEFDGIQHKEQIDFFGDFNIIQEKDKIKNEYAKSKNIPLVRIPYYKRDSITLQDLMGEQFLI